LESRVVGVVAGQKRERVEVGFFRFSKLSLSLLLEPPCLSLLLLTGQGVDLQQTSPALSEAGPVELFTGVREAFSALLRFCEATLHLF